MKKIIQFSVDYPVTISMVVLGILLLGFISLQKLNVDLFPELNSPIVFVEIKAGEIPPEEIEQRFIQGIESMAIRQKGVVNVSAVCMSGSARMTVEYSWGTDMNEAFLDLQKSLASFAADENIESLNITQHDPNASPVMIIAVRNPSIEDLDEMRKIGEGYIRNELIRLEGIADVVISGIEEKQLFVSTDDYKLAAYGLSVDDIVQRIESLNQTVSGGSIVEQGLQYLIKGAGSIKNKQELENLVVGFKQPAIPVLPAAGNTGANGTRVPLYLKDVATIGFANKEPENIVRINGERCMGLSVYRETGYNTVRAVENLTNSLASIEKALPGFQFMVAQDQGSFIKQAIGEVKESALLGSIIAILVLFFFLRRVGVTLIISIAIPISVVATFNLMYFNHLSLNIMTLGGLALGAGMLVDNAIVVVESIFRNLEKGMPVKEAAVKGASNVGAAIIASTLTTVVVFLPIVYLTGASSAMFKDQAWTVSFSLIASLFVAILVIPMLFHQIYKKRESPKRPAIQFHWYGSFLDHILDYRKSTLILTAILIALTAFIYPMVGSEYLPKSEAGGFSLEIALKEGAYLHRTEGVVHNIENLLEAAFGDQIEAIYSQIGSGASLDADDAVFMGDHTALVKVILAKDAREQSDQMIQTIREMTSGLPDVEIKVIADGSSLASDLGAGEAPVVVEIKGRELDQLEQIGASVKTAMMGIPELINVETNIENGAPELDVVIDRSRASLYGLNSAAIITQLQGRLMGKNAGHFENQGELNDIVVKLPEVALTELKDFRLKGDNTDVPLFEVATISASQAPKKLFRRNQNRIARVTANLQGDIAFDKAIEKVKLQLSSIPLPPRYEMEVEGEEAKRQETMSSMGFALALSLILVYMVMASQFESLIHPFTILLTIPLAGVGAIWAFFLLDMSLNMMAYIGLIMLAGIAVNNAIILVDAINKLKEQGKDLRSAIVEAGVSRIRPIVMTSLTTILALLPLTFGFGESASLRSPLAVAVIAGLITSTLLTLAVIPCLYYVFDRRVSTGGLSSGS